jgi:hypothetical protein
MRAKQFFYACAGILMLVAAYSIGASRAQGQSPVGRIVAASPFGQYNSNIIVVQDDGRVFMGYMGTAPGTWEELTPVPGSFYGNQ